MSNNSKLFLFVGGGAILVMIIIAVLVYILTSGQEPEEPSGQVGFPQGETEDIPDQVNNDEPLEIAESPSGSGQSNSPGFQPDEVEDPQTSEFVPDEVDDTSEDSAEAIAYLNQAKQNETGSSGADSGGSQDTTGNASSREYSPELQAVLDAIENDPESIYSSEASAAYFENYDPLADPEESLQNLLEHGTEFTDEHVQMVIDDAESGVIEEDLDFSDPNNCDFIDVSREQSGDRQEFASELSDDGAAQCFGREAVGSCDTSKVVYGGLTYILADVDGKCSFGPQANEYANLCSIESAIDDYSSDASDSEIGQLMAYILGTSGSFTDCQAYRF